MVDGLWERARRFGPLPASALGVGAPPNLPDGVAVWVAAQIDRVWAELGRPDPLVVVDVDAGDGARAQAVLGSRPQAGPALRYVLVTDDPGIGSRLDLESSGLVLGPAVPSADDDDPPGPPPGMGPLVAALTDLPAGLDQALILALGWLSRLPADRFVRRDGTWREVRRAVAGDHLVDLEVDAALPDPQDAFVDGDEYLDRRAARQWLARAVAAAGRGRVLVLDHLTPGAVAQLTTRRHPRAAFTRPFPHLVHLEWE
ncbi:MAG: hypothetical protein ACRDXE_07790 [Acidimicrobiales bacterium]